MLDEVQENRFSLMRPYAGKNNTLCILAGRQTHTRTHSRITAATERTDFSLDSSKLGRRSADDSLLRVRQLIQDLN